MDFSVFKKSAVLATQNYSLALNQILSRVGLRVGAKDPLMQKSMRVHIRRFFVRALALYFSSSGLVKFYLFNKSAVHATQNYSLSNH